jgi:2-polyprenyl-3-methyl-5-hydroxy-6-metoxy-1,4-benzoquinol methylase
MTTAPETAPYSLSAERGTLYARPLPDGLWEVRVEPRTADTFVERDSCVTDFPREIVEAFLDHSGVGWICDSIARHCDETYVNRVIQKQIFSYFAPADFSGKRLLDFGCGSGGSTFGLARMLTTTEIIGVELSPENIELAQRVAAFRTLPNVRVLQSPAPDRLPEDIGNFDFVMMSAVFEHLLPDERKLLMPLIWSKMKPGAVLFINQTPHRYVPYEHHSTGLWFVNYLPDRWTHKLTVALTRHKSTDWNEHLRGGIRGGTEREIIQRLSPGHPRAAQILRPSQNGLSSRADYWLACTSSKHRAIKRVLHAFFSVTDTLFDTIPALNVDVVIRKKI